MAAVTNTNGLVSDKSGLGPTTVVINIAKTHGTLYSSFLLYILCVMCQSTIN